MTDFTQLTNEQLSEAINFHRRQRNLSRGINEAMHMRQTQMVRLLEAEEARRLEEAPLLGPNSAIHRAASMNQSDREYAHQMSFKNKWKADNPGKQWPGYEKAGYKHPSYKTEEVELDEQAMTFQNAEKLKNKHLVAMDHHKKSGNSKGYAAHSMVVRKFEDVYDRHGTGVIPAGRILSASQKAFKDHPHSNMKEEVELDEVSTEKLRDYASAALQDKNKAKADKRWKYASKAMDTVADREVKAAHARKYNKTEEVELDEATLRITKVYHKFPKKPTYAVHNADRSYHKEFDSMEAAKAHHAEKSK